MFEAERNDKQSKKGLIKQNTSQIMKTCGCITERECFIVEIKNILNFHLLCPELWAYIDS